MKMYGDISDEHKQLMTALDQQERVFDMDNLTDTAKLAKGYVCLAHDWYILGNEDRGVVLLRKAEQIFPGYFRTMIAKHCYQDADFEYLVRNITAELVNIMLSSIQDEQT